MYVRVLEVCLVGNGLRPLTVLGAKTLGVLNITTFGRPLMVLVQYPFFNSVQHSYASHIVTCLKYDLCTFSKIVWHNTSDQPEVIGICAMCRINAQNSSRKFFVQFLLPECLYC